MTTRKHALIAVIGVFALSGCATRGPLHVYALTAHPSDRPSEPELVDASDEGRVRVPTFLSASDRASGFAYDPFTDHIFLRLQPGDRIRVIDRPARAVKREFKIDRPEAVGGGDLTVRPRDGHLFLLGGAGGHVIETTRLGKVVRVFTLAGITTAPEGIAFDAVNDRLLVLAADGRRITVHEPRGGMVGEYVLARPVQTSLALDAARNELYAPLRDRPGEIGVFDTSGRFLRTSAAAGAFVDVGERSLIRMF